MREEFAHVDADAAGTDDGDGLADGLALSDDLGVGQHLRVLDAGDLGNARRHAGGNHHFVEGSDEICWCDAGFELDRHSGHVQHAGVVANGLGELFLTRNELCDPELSADLVRGLEQRDRMTTLSKIECCGKSGRTGADDGEILGPPSGGEDQRGLTARARI